MSNRESVQAISGDTASTYANSPNLYIREYKKYAHGTASGISAQEMRRL